MLPRPEQKGRAGRRWRLTPQHYLYMAGWEGIQSRGLGLEIDETPLTDSDDVRTPSAEEGKPSPNYNPTDQ
jgi:hypothetical protein